MNEKQFCEEILVTHFGSSANVKRVQSVAGGCINTTLKIESSKGSFFIKLNSPDQHDLFEKEERGLEILTEKSGINIPKVMGSGHRQNKAYLILEWIEKGHQNTEFWIEFGRQLAFQHKRTATNFGLDHDNHIGLLPQSNTSHANWYEFFILERLLPQISLAKQNGLLDSTIQTQFESLFKKLAELIPKETPSLLHGDLWSGNFLCGTGSRPYIFDPAVYFGHRETELAFTTLFGGFHSLFYESYNEEFKLQPGFEERTEIHNLYPLLVHVNLFGSSYLSGIKNTLQRFV